MNGYMWANDNGDDCVIIENCTKSIRASRRGHWAPVAGGVELPRSHNCSNACVKKETTIQLNKLSLFHRPLAIGFQHLTAGNKTVAYKSPCGRMLVTYNAIQKYLIKTNSMLRIDSFTLEPNFNPSENKVTPAVFRSFKVIRNVLPNSLSEVDYFKFSALCLSAIDNYQSVSI